MRNLIALLIVGLIIITSCQSNVKLKKDFVRNPIDSIGFAYNKEQLETVILRIEENQKKHIARIEADEYYQNINNPRVVISPHDDYSYVGYLYPETLKKIAAKTVVLFGVAHKAKQFGLENQIVFGSHTHWNAPAGNVKVSSFQGQLLKLLPDDLSIVHDSMQIIEHSLEALVPFLQYYNPEIEIIPILVPYMSYKKMLEISESLSVAIKNVMDENNLHFGKDISFVISSDAVHYGDEDWGGKSYARFGVDSIGYKEAMAYEWEIINECFNGEISNQNALKFVNYTVEENNYKKYKWTWCGRYSIPLGLLTANELINLSNASPLIGIPIDYSTSIENKQIKVDDIGLGTTAPAKLQHWVGYPSILFK